MPHSCTCTLGPHASLLHELKGRGGGKGILELAFLLETVCGKTLAGAISSACEHRPLTCVSVGGGTQLSLHLLWPAAVDASQGAERTICSCSCSCFDPQTGVGNAISSSALHHGAEEAAGGTCELVTCGLHWTCRCASVDSFGVFSKLESVAGI